METVIYRFTLDCRKSGIQKTLQGFGTGDSLTRKLAITLVYGTTTYEIDADHCEAMMYVKDPVSGVTSINACTIEGNTIHYTMQTSDFRNPGEVIMQAKLIYTNPKSGVRKVIVAPRFALEVEHTENIDRLIEEKLEEKTYEGSFTALEMAVGKAQAYYHSRLVQIEIDEDYVFHCYYADGTEYVNDGLSEAFKKCIESADITTEIAKGMEELANATEVLTNMAKSSYLAAKEAQNKAEMAAEQAIRESSYAAFFMNFETGNIEYDSNNYNWFIDSNGYLNYALIE